MTFVRNGRPSSTSDAPCRPPAEALVGEQSGCASRRRGALRARHAAPAGRACRLPPLQHGTSPWSSELIAPNAMRDQRQGGISAAGVVALLLRGKRSGRAQTPHRRTRGAPAEIESPCGAGRRDAVGAVVVAVASAAGEPAWSAALIIWCALDTQGGELQRRRHGSLLAGRSRRRSLRARARRGGCRAAACARRSALATPRAHAVRADRPPGRRTVRGLPRARHRRAPSALASAPAPAAAVPARLLHIRPPASGSGDPRLRTEDH